MISGSSFSSFEMGEFFLGFASNLSPFIIIIIIYIYYWLLWIMWFHFGNQVVWMFFFMTRGVRLNLHASQLISGPTEYPISPVNK
jgi:membrane-associated phospholipid phosphatase